MYQEGYDVGFGHEESEREVSFGTESRDKDLSLPALERRILTTKGARARFEHGILSYLQ